MIRTRKLTPDAIRMISAAPNDLIMISLLLMRRITRNTNGRRFRMDRVLTPTQYRHYKKFKAESAARRKAGAR